MQVRLYVVILHYQVNFSWSHSIQFAKAFEGEKSNGHGLFSFRAFEKAESTPTTTRGSQSNVIAV
jgi:hypothetical protein